METTTTKPETFLDVIKTLLAVDIAYCDEFKILALGADGKYGHGKFMLEGEDKNGPYKVPYKVLLYFTFKPGNRFMTGYAYDYIKKESFEISEDMEHIYGELDTMGDFYNFKNWNIFNGVAYLKTFNK